MADIFPKLVNMSVSASWLVLAVIILRLLLKKAPKWIYCMLWALVAVRLICPFSIESSLSLIPGAETVPEEMFKMEPVENRQNASLDIEVNPAIPGSYTPELDKTVERVQIEFVYAELIWRVGFIAMLLYAFISCLRLKNRVKTAVILQKNIYQSENIVSPFVFGFLRPRIYLPFKVSEKDAVHMLAHEQSHIRRHDHQIKPFAFLLLSLYWFNPVIWAAYILLCRDIETACDERVIKELGAEQRADYSQALLTCSVPRRMISACPVAFGEVGVKERVRNVLSYKKPTLWVIVVAVISCIAVAVCFLTNPKDKTFHDPFGYSYRVETVAYDAPQYNFTYSPKTAPLYTVTSYNELVILEEQKSDEWTTAGIFSEIQLTEENFKSCFTKYDLYNESDADKLLQNNSKAWQLFASEPDSNPPSNVFYYLLLQKNGDVYLTYGYFNPDNMTAPNADMSIRWIFKLKEDSTAAPGLVGGENNDAENKQFTVNLCIVDGADKGILVLAGAGEGDVYTLNPFDENVEIYLDGKAAGINALKDGMMAEISYDGTVEETYPAKLRNVTSVSVYSAGTEEGQGSTLNLCGLYLRVLNDLWEADKELNVGISYVSVDLSTAPGGLTQGEKSAVAWAFANAHQVGGLTLSFKELAKQGCLADIESGTEDSLPGYWKDGVLFSITQAKPARGEAYSLPTLKFDAQKWRSVNGAYMLYDCTATLTGAGEYSYSAGGAGIA